MRTLKNPFAPAVEASVKGKQLLKGRTRARLESLTAELQAARMALEQAEEAVGNQLVEGLDVTAATEKMNEASDRVRILESALAIAIKKDEAAQAELNDAEVRVQKGLKRELLISLNDAARAIDAWLDSGKPVIEAYHARRKAVQDLGDFTLNTQLAVADASFKTYLFRTCAPMGGCQTGYSAFQTDPKWSAPWSSTNPQPDADHGKL